MIKEYDSLTGIYSFPTFLSVTRDMLDSNPDTEYVMMVVDIERFKVINEMFSMEKGDRVLKSIASIFSKYVGRRNGTYGRIGSDRFVSCYPKNLYSEEEISSYLTFVISEGDLNYRVFMQAGLYFIDERDIDVIKMCDRALMALKNIKGRYSEKISVYSENARYSLVETQQLISDIDSALQDKEFKIYVQPVYRLKDNKMVSGEVLVRWEHPKHGLLMPGRFIPIFEKNYVISRLDKYIWEEACLLIRRMMDTKDVVMPLSINVSRVDLLLEDVVGILKGLVEKYDIPYKYLRVEITESAYMDSPEKLINTIKALKELGFIVLMDDFGAGYSSLNTLKDLSFDVLKIDKKLIDEVDDAGKGGSVVMSVIRMARWLGMKVVAEGIEKCTQANLLRMIGCDYLQGYLYSRPVDVETFLSKIGEKVDVESIQLNERLNFEYLFTAKDLYTKIFAEELIGPLAIFELEGNRLKFLEANETYSRKYETKDNNLLQFVGILSDDIELPIYKKIVKRCKDAYETKSPEYYTFAVSDNNGERQWIKLKIIYYGDRVGTHMYIFSITDVTKDVVQADKREAKELYPLLCTMFTEIIEFNYSQNTLTTLHKNDKIINARHEHVPLDDMLDKFFNYMIPPEHREQTRYYLSQDFVNGLFQDGKKIFSFKLEMYDKNKNPYPCEMTLIKRIGDANSLAVLVCTRVIDESN